MEYVRRAAESVARTVNRHLLRAPASVLCEHDSSFRAILEVESHFERASIFASYKHHANNFPSATRYPTLKSTSSTKRSEFQLLQQFVNSDLIQQLPHEAASSHLSQISGIRQRSRARQASIIADLESHIVNNQLRLNGAIIRSESHFIALCTVLRRHGASLLVLRLHDIDLCIRQRAERLAAALFQGQTALRLLSFTDCSLGVVRRDGSSALDSLLQSMSHVSHNSSVVASMHSLRLERQSLTDRHLSTLRAFVERASDNLREISLAGNGFTRQKLLNFIESCALVRDSARRPLISFAL